MWSRALSQSVLALALSTEVAAGASAQALELASRGPRFIAAWSPSGRAVEASNILALRRRVSLDLVDATVDEAIRKITRQADLEISYSKASLPAGHRVSLHVREITVAAALTEVLLDAGVDVAVGRGGEMALVKRPAALAEVSAGDSGSVSGQVIDKATGAPIDGATVIVEGTRFSVTTESGGRYRITDVPAGTYRLRARYIGYEPGEISATVRVGGEAVLDFALDKAAQVLDEVVTVTPGGMQTSVRALPTPVTVIKADEIARQHPQALADVIRQVVPSAVAFYSPGLPIFTDFTVRGLSSISGGSSMKILVDGIEASAFAFAPVDPASIERIEVVRGPQAATVYGADAAGGVVQIFTKRGDSTLTRPHVDLRAEAGVLQTPYTGFGEVLRQEYSGSVRGGSKAVSYQFGAGYTRLPDWIPDGELSRQKSGSVYGGMRYTDRLLNADIHARYYPGTYGTVSNPLLLETGFPFASRPNFQRQDYANETYGARLMVTPASWWQTSFTLGVDGLSNQGEQTQPRLTSPDDTLLLLYDVEQQKISLGLNTALSRALGTEIRGMLTAGIDHFRSRTSTFFTFQALNTDGPIRTEPPGAIDEGRTSTTNTGYFAQSELSWRDAVFLTAGLRTERNSSFGQNLSAPVLPRVGLSVVHDIKHATIKARIAYGQAIRVPLPLQAIGGVAPFAITLPNFLLGPERQQGWDAGIDLVLGSRGSLSITGYQQTAENLVIRSELANDSLPTFQYQNLGRVENRGFELEGTLTAFDWMQLRAQYGYVRARVEDLGSAASPGARIQVGDRNPGIPTHTAGATLTLSPRAGTTLTAGLTYVGSFRRADVIAQFRCFGGTGPCHETPRDYIVTYPGFERVNVSLSQSILPQLSGLISVSNLTHNLAYDGDNGQPVMGRTTMVGFHFQH